MPCFGAGVNPSMNPSRVQLRRYAIHGSLITPTPKHYSLTLCKNQLSQLESLEQLQKYATDWQTTSLVETQCAGFVASAPGMAQRPNRVRKTR